MILSALTEVVNIGANNTGKYIYKITNTINGKCYIGQTKDYKERFKGHQLQLSKNRHENYHLQAAWNKYGANAFTFEVLEYAEDYNEREKYYIRLYNSTNELYGYNILEGGENPPVRACSILSLADVQAIQTMLANQCSFDSICELFPCVTRGHIAKINSGAAWYDDMLSYPLKIDHDNEIGIDVAGYIIDDLLNTNLTQREIAQKYGVSRTCVTAINNGNVQKYYNDKYNYPLRKPNNHLGLHNDSELLNLIIADIKNTKLSFRNIAKKYNISREVLRHINNGEGKYYKNNVSYPIRSK